MTQKIKPAIIDTTGATDGHVLKNVGGTPVWAVDGGGSGGGGAWGEITGTLSDQTDLQTALNAKLSTSGGTLTGDLTIDTATSSLTLQDTSGSGWGGTIDGAGGSLSLNANGHLHLIPNGGSTYLYYAAMQKAVTTLTGLSVTGNVEVSGNLTKAGSASINNGAMTMNTSRILGRTTASTGAVEELTYSAVTGLLDLAVANGAKGLLSGADKAKLDGIASGATANSSDATLKDRSNHTGEQAISTITGLQTALDGKEGAITAGTTSQYFRGNKTWATLNKAAVGLANVDNTSDANKPVSTATQTALNAKLNTSEYIKGVSIFCSGKPANSEVIGGSVAPYALTLNQANCYAKAVTAAAASTTFIIKNNGTQIGTVVFGTAAAIGTVDITTPAVSQGDHITVHAPATADTALADISVVLRT